MIEYRHDREFAQEDLASLFCSVGWFSGGFPDRLQRAFRNSGRVISAWDGGELVGLIRGLDDGAWQATIDCLLVRPTHQGRGIASTMLNEMLELYRDFLYIYVVPEDSRNVGFYKKHGFTVMEDGTPLYIRNPDWQ